MKTYAVRIPMWAILLCALVLSMCVGRAHADVSTSTPLFNWSGAPTGTTSVKIYCDGVVTKRREINMPTLTWQTVATDFTPGQHNCYASAIGSTGVLATSASVSFTIPPAVVVVPPPVPFVLIVK